MSYPPQNAPPVEGEYSAWTKVWQKDTATAYGADYASEQIVASEINNRLIMFTNGAYRIIVNLSNGTIIGTVGTMKDGNATLFGTETSFSRYFAEVVTTGATYNLNIYKDCLLIQTIDLCSDLGITYASGKWWVVAWTKNGKYLTVSYDQLTFVISLYKGA